MSITKLGDVRKVDVATVGGKAANLGELIGMGMPVPEGYVVTEYPGPHYSHSMAGDGLGKRVAVRSSGIAEDGARASMAGQHDTYLDVFNSPEFVTPAIRKCFESVNNPRAVAYREENGITEDRVAVIVQRMIDPLYSGVLFTADPVTGDRNAMEMEWVMGTGEKLVSGEAIPASTQWLKHFMPAVPKGSQCLPHLALEIEGHFGCPQDIEWCVDKDYKLWILQARPITTL
jgi:phosphoenolpyruvate synthase/pyruvate phosphate dikinase